MEGGGGGQKVQTHKQQQHYSTAERPRGVPSAQKDEQILLRISSGAMPRGLHGIYMQLGVLHGYCKQRGFGRQLEPGQSLASCFTQPQTEPLKSREIRYKTRTRLDARSHSQK